jgi:MinD superfamily P-loop ATPase
MKQVTVLSGKGGTGKTVVTASLARLAGPVVAVDADVDAANLALLLPGEDEAERPFCSGYRAVVQQDLCTACTACLTTCRFGAVDLDDYGLARIDPLRCEGCGACRLICPSGAVTMVDNQAGTWRLRETACGPLVHARLGVAQGNSGKLVTHLGQVARATAEERGIGVVLVDGPPGIGCPVHAALGGADFVVAVTEPTRSGEHDLERLLALTTRFRVPVGLVINKHDLGAAVARRMEEAAARQGAVVLGRVPFEPEVPRALARRQTLLSLPRLGPVVEAVWSALQGELGSGTQRASSGA